MREDGTTSVPGLRVAGDLTGIPLLKFSADTGAKAIQGILAEPDFAATRGQDPAILDVAIVGAGIAGVSAAIEARKAGLHFAIYEATQNFSTVANFPVRKPIFTYPTDMDPSGDLKVTATVKEELLDELERQRIAAGIEPIHRRIGRVRRHKGGLLHLVPAGDDSAEPIPARRVVVAIGRSGSFRKLGVPGEGLGKVSNRLHDPQDFTGKKALVIGGGDSALETAVALAACGADVTLSYRKAEFSRAKPENIEMARQLASDPRAEVQIEEPSSDRVTTSVTTEMAITEPEGSLRIAMSSQVREIREEEVVLALAEGGEETVGNDVVFSMIGREPPLDFFRRSGVPIRGEWRPSHIAGLVFFLLFCVWLYHWKSYNWFAFDWLNPSGLWEGVVERGRDRPGALLYTVAKSASGPSFYYTLAYSLLILVFGIRRIRRRRTPYVKVQTVTLMCVQWVPLFLLPEILLPWMGRNGWFLDGAALRPVADALFESYDGGVGMERAYWRAYGFIFAWPLFVYNWFTAQGQVLWTWAVIGGIQTFVLIPLLVFRWGKGAYCGWICSCGALAETLGDTHRHKMPHGPRWNRLNVIGQVILLLAFVMLALRIYGLVYTDSWIAANFETLLEGKTPWSYKWIVDVMLAGALGYGVYFWLSGRVWCRFACPLAALMHIYARFSRFRIFADKKKCISCNVCTSVCHQGIDVMNFANKGLPMEDPQCVRCSACVQGCPTGTLSFGRLGSDRLPILDRLPASRVQAAEQGRS